MKAIVFLSCLLFMLSGCTRYYYGPTQHNVPMFKEKHEARLSATYSGLEGEGSVQGWQVQAAYAPTKGLGLIANAAFFGQPDDAISNASDYGADNKGRLYELGAGYYK